MCVCVSSRPPPLHTHRQTQTQTQTHTHTDTDTHTHTGRQTDRHTHTHTDTGTCTHTRTAGGPYAFSAASKCFLASAALLAFISPLFLFCRLFVCLFGECVLCFGFLLSLSHANTRTLSLPVRDVCMCCKELEEPSRDTGDESYRQKPQHRHMTTP